MQIAIQQGKNCPSVDGAYNVGAVITVNGQFATFGYSRQVPGNTHAEENALNALLAKHPKKESLENVVLYTTMEPCSTRTSGKKSCTDIILECGFISKIFYCVDEPPLFVDCVGKEILVGAGIPVIQIPQLINDCKKLNSHLFN
ncbi:hypothetical protein BB559_007109 [Furculomyces boomerangus]|uniref:CMP/dCMP-type deaminase domain-containing protein n=1 Tax=Furculomyces boomerangus TaxID=61424 RepID=A0A2T9XYY8_9FUNG|nr:hypothetical protein BB559_007109 [Furculomyces boomerangus]